MNITFWRLPNEGEIWDAVARTERAIRERRIIRVSFLKEVKVNSRPVWFADIESDPLLTAAFGHRKMLTAQPTRRTIEPLMCDLNADGEPYLRGICHDPSGAEYPELRTVRLDRVPVSSRSGLRLTVTQREFVVADTALDPARRPVTV